MVSPDATITTLEEYFALPEDNARHHELLDGVYVVTPAQRPLRQIAIAKLFHRLHPAFQNFPELELFPVLGDLVLGPRTAVQPDLFVIPRPASVQVEWRDVERPVFIVEVLSPSTAARDRGIKRRLYQEAGIPEYWIVDLDARLIERWRPGDARPEIAFETLSWSLPGGPSGTLNVAEYFLAVLGD